MTEKTILVTGATDGVGRITAQALASQGHRVLIHGRSDAKLEQTAEAIRASTGSQVECYRADLSSLDAVRGMARAITDHHGKLDALINNAGLGPGPAGSPRQVSEDGHELRFQVNYLAPVLLTRLLLPLLRIADGRVVHVASAAQEALDFNDLMSEHGYTGMRAYARSKLAILMDALTLAGQECEGQTGVMANALDPGSMLNTKMVREAMGTGHGRAEDGAEAQAFLATDDACRDITGRYFLQKRQTSPHRQALDDNARSALRVATLLLLGESI